MLCVKAKATRSKLRAGEWRGADLESAEGAAPRSPPASAVHNAGLFSETRHPPPLCVLYTNKTE